MDRSGRTRILCGIVGFLTLLVVSTPSRAGVLTIVSQTRSVQTGVHDDTVSPEQNTSTTTTAPDNNPWTIGPSPGGGPSAGQATAYQKSGVFSTSSLIAVCEATEGVPQFPNHFPFATSACHMVFSLDVATPYTLDVDQLGADTPVLVSLSGFAFDPRIRQYHLTGTLTPGQYTLDMTAVADAKSFSSFGNGASVDLELATPEPSAAMLLTASAVAALMRRRKRAATGPASSGVS